MHVTNSFPVYKFDILCGSCGFCLLNNERIHRSYLFYTFQRLIPHVDIKIFFIHLDFVYTNVTESSIRIITVLQTHRVVKYIPFPTVFFQMGVIVAEIESIISRIFKIIVAVFPATTVKRILASHICHATSSWLLCRDRENASKFL